MQKLYVIGGQQKSDRSLLENDQDWYAYQKGVILQVDPDTGSVEKCYEYVSPPEVRGKDDPILFKAGTIEGSRLYLSTQTEILILSLPGFDQVGYVSLPCFNDVHHVRPTPEGNLLVANSGLEMVLELTPQGEVIREWNVLGEDPWERFSKTIDYRQGINLKPHRAHPNYIFTIGDDIWATRFEQKDAVCLTRPGRCLHVGIERVHDGVYHEGVLYLTTVNGRLVAADLEALTVKKAPALQSLQGEDALLGWCRGLLVEDGHAWIGFSRIRPTKFREAVSWVRQGFSKSLPTHIARYDLQDQRCLAEINLESYGLNAVFSILPAPID